FPAKIYYISSMNISLSLIEFIQDFNLRNSDGVVCFDAAIEFNIGGKVKKIRSEVQIVHIDDNDQETIYLLNPDIKLHEVPDMFSSRNEIFTYFPLEYLK